MEEKKYVIDEDDLKNMLAYCSMEEVRVLTEIVDHFDSYKFVKIYEETYSHDAPEDMGEEWDSDKETRTIIGFTINEKQGWLTACDSECGYFNGVQLDFDGQEIDLPFAGYWFGQEIHKNPAVLKQYLEEVLQIIEKEIGTRELMRRDDFAHVLCSSLIENKEPQEKHDYERVLYALKNNGFHVAMTNVDTSIKGDHIALLYEDDIAPMVTFDIANLPAIKFGRELYKFLALNIKTEESKKVQQMLIAMFSGKQKTTAKPQADAVDNKTRTAIENKSESAAKKEDDNMDNPYNEMAKEEAEEAVQKKYIDIFPLLAYKGRTSPVRRRLLLMDKGNGFYAGAVYHVSGTKLGTWYWNINAVGKKGYSFPPVFRPVPELANVYDKDIVYRYQLAIKKALRLLGIYGKYVPEDVGQYITKKVVETVKLGQKYEPAPEPDNTIPTDSQFWGPAV